MNGDTKKAAEPENIESLIKTAIDTAKELINIGNEQFRVYIDVAAALLARLGEGNAQYPRFYNELLSIGGKYFETNYAGLGETK